MRPKFIIPRLSLMMFFQFLGPGLIIPIISFYLLKYLKFTGIQVGVVLAASSISTFIAPLTALFIVDRVLSCERLLSICNITSGIVLIILSFQNQFLPFFLLYTLFVILSGPSIALISSIVFHNIDNGNHVYGKIRLWGTISWILVSMFFGFFWLGGLTDKEVTQRLPDFLKIAGAFFIISGFYAFTLPSTFSRKNIIKSFKDIIPVDSFKIIFNKYIIIVLIISFIFSLAERYYYFGAGPYLKLIGIREKFILPVLSLGAVPEILAMFLLGFIISKIGFKKALILGVFFSACRFTAFFIGSSKIIIISGILFHGLAFAFFTTTFIILLDNLSSKENRAGVQQLFAVVYMGLGSLFGHNLAGITRDYLKIFNDPVLNNKAFWFIPLLLVFMCIILMILFFKDKKIVNV